MSKSPSLRRIQADIRELALDPSDRYHAAPLEDDMFEWHFTIRGADGTDFEGGVYHGRILLPPEYPFKPPNIVFLTPSGRFETGTKVCLSFSAYHPELWQPAWGIRLILEALISFLPTPADGAIGALDWSSAERKKLATKSLDYCCPRCGKAVQLLPKPASTERKSSSASRFQKEIERLHQLQWEHEGKRKAEEMEKAEENNDAVKGEIEGGKSNNEEQNNSVVEVKGSDHTADYVKDKEDGVASNERMKAPELKTEEQSKDVDTMPERHSDDDKKVEAAANKELEINNTLHQEPAAETTPVAAVSSTTITATTAEVAEANNTNNATVVVAHSEQFWLIDPALQCTVVLLAIICYMLIRKGHALYEEIRRLD